MKEAMRSVARRHQVLHEEIALIDKRLAALVKVTAPAGLLEKHGVGVQVASALLATAGDNPERLRSEASFAALCGVSPINASTGKHPRHRLNRSGDRQANHALWCIAFTRMRSDPRTKAYVARRRAEGKNDKEIMRCLKRYIAREIYNTIVRDTPTEQLFEEIAVAA